MLRRWVLTTAGFSFGGASFLAVRSFLMRPIGLRFRPRPNRRRARAWTSCGNGEWGDGEDGEWCVLLRTRGRSEIVLRRLEGDTHIFIAEIKELLEGYSPVGECAEGSLLLDLCGEGGVGDSGISL